MRNFAWIFGILLLTTSFAFAQETRLDVMLGATESFPKQVTGTGVTLTSTDNLGFLGSIRWYATPRFGIELNYGRTLNAQTYNAPPFLFRVQNTTSEYSGAAVITPFETSRYHFFVLGGLGAVRFYPKTVYINGFSTGYSGGFGDTAQSRLAFLYGLGVDYKFFPHLALRLQYRGLLYKAQDYNSKLVFTGSTAHIAEPSAGIVFRF